MTDIAFEYTHSKHSRRFKSRLKKCERLSIKNKNIRKNNQIKFKEKIHINSNKSMRELQRKQWLKYNKKRKARANINQHLIHKIKSFQWNEIIEYDSTNEDDYYTYPTIQHNEIEIKQAESNSMHIVEHDFPWLLIGFGDKKVKHQINNPCLIIEHVICGYIARTKNIFVPNDIKTLMTLYLLPHGFDYKDSYVILSRYAVQITFADNYLDCKRSKSYHVRQSVLFGHTTSVTSICSVKNKHLLYSTSHDKSIIVWSLSGKQYVCEDLELTHDAVQPFLSGTMENIIYAHTHCISDMDFKLNGGHDEQNKFNIDMMVTCSMDKTIKLWCITQDNKFTLACSVKQQFGVKNIRFLHGLDDDCIVSIMKNGTVTLWKLLIEDNGQHEIWQHEMIHNDYDACTVSIVTDIPTFYRDSDGFDVVLDCIMVIGINDTIYIFKDKELNAEIHKTTYLIHAMELSPDCSVLATAHENKEIILWDLDEFCILSKYHTASSINDILFGTNTYWVVAAHGSTITIWDLETRTIIFDFDNEDDAYLLCDGTLIEKRNTINRADMEKRNHAATCVAFSYDGNILFVGCANGAINTYDFSGC